LTAASGGTPQSVVSNASGAYEFSQVNPGQYTFSASLPGFTSYSRTVTVRSGAASSEDVLLQVARTVTSVQVSVARAQTAPTAPADPTSPRPPVPLRIGGDISAPSLFRCETSVPAALAQQIQGFVQLRGIVDTQEGHFSRWIFSGQREPRIRAAMDAVGGGATSLQC
jgi:hypothetical protein